MITGHNFRAIESLTISRCLQIYTVILSFTQSEIQMSRKAAAPDSAKTLADGLLHWNVSQLHLEQLKSLCVTVCAWTWIPTNRDREREKDRLRKRPQFVLSQSAQPKSTCTKKRKREKRAFNLYDRALWS